MVKNDADCEVTIKFYHNWDVTCMISHASDVIMPGTTFSRCHKKGCRIELIARFESDNKKGKKVLLKPQAWASDQSIRITDNLDVETNSLTSEEKESCLGKNNREEELASLEAGGCNLYDILRLNMKEVRAMEKKEQGEEIEKAFHRQIKIWHRDCNSDGDDDIVRKVIMAYEILGNREKRARYNNMADYDSGWLPKRLFKAIFFPECETIGQRLAWIKRMALLALTVGIRGGGILSIVPNRTQRLPSGKVVVSALVEDAPETLCAKEAEAVEKLRAQNVAEIEDSVEQISEYTNKKLDAALNSIEKAKPTDGIIRYISKGYWVSKMAISYVDVLTGKNVTLESKGNGSQVTIPSTAERIEVRFKVLRPPWRDIQKYDRFQGRWCEPYEAHIFHYDTPPTRTFTIGGPLYREAVIKITDQYANETEEM